MIASQLLERTEDLMDDARGRCETAAALCLMAGRLRADILAQVREQPYRRALRGLASGGSDSVLPKQPLLREQAREAIRQGRIPAGRPDRCWAGPGVGVECAICGVEIPKGQSEMEIEFVQEARLDTFHVHLRCFDAWELERRKPGVAAPESPLSH